MQEGVSVGSVYQHYKGNNYRVIGVGLHSETLEEFVVYQALYETPDFGMNALWVRPKSMFFEMMEFNGVLRQRFTLVRF